MQQSLNIKENKENIKKEVYEMGLFDRLEKSPVFTKNFIIFLIAIVFCLLVVVYVIINLKNSDRIYQIIINILSIITGYLGGKAVNGKD